MPSEKWELPPLLDAGLHVYTLGGIRELCVEPFPLSKTRSAIFSGLSHVVRTMSANEVVGEFWIDGGFMTSSINPPDVDVVLCLESAFYVSCSEEQRLAIDLLNHDDEVADDYLCHSYISNTYPEGHEQWHDGNLDRARWRDWFGFSRRPRRTPKGIAVLRLIGRVSP
jgi:hypothetical protein